MNIVRVIILFSTVISSISFIKCSDDPNQLTDPVNKIKLDTVKIPHSIKGWELYSWPYGKSWNFSVLAGTNRVKSFEEVTKNKLIVSGTYSLKMLLDKFPENEEISWIGKEWLGRCWSTNSFNLSLPDVITINVIKAYCIQEKLNLSILY